MLCILLISCYTHVDCSNGLDYLQWHLRFLDTVSPAVDSMGVDRCMCHHFRQVEGISHARMARAGCWIMNRYK